MIATLAFDPPHNGVRRARFIPRPALPVDAACVVANGIREALRTLLGEACTLTMGEPVVLDAQAWRSLAHDALAFATPGRATDVVFVLALRDARALVHAAFGEEPALADGSWSALEAGAIERIVARCANACDALCVERRGATTAVDIVTLPRPVAYVDVRVSAPIALTFGLGIIRELSDPPPSRMVSPATLYDVALPVTVVLGRGTLTIPRLLELQVGTVVPLSTQVAEEGELKLAGQRIALGTCGVRNSRPAFEVRYPV